MAVSYVGPEEGLDFGWRRKQASEEMDGLFAGKCSSWGGAEEGQRYVSGKLLVGLACEREEDTM